MSRIKLVLLMIFIMAVGLVIANLIEPEHAVNVFNLKLKSDVLVAWGFSVLAIAIWIMSEIPTAFRTLKREREMKDQIREMEKEIQDLQLKVLNEEEKPE